MKVQKIMKFYQILITQSWSKSTIEMAKNLLKINNKDTEQDH